MPGENDTTVDAAARGDILPSVDDDKGSTASAAPTGEDETPSSDSQTAPTGGAATSTADGDAGEKDEDDDAGDPKEHRIPQSRFKEAVQRERERAQALERELNKYRTREQQQTAAADFQESQKQLKELIKQHSSLLADGDLDKASDVMGQVFQLQSDMADARAKALAENTRNSTKNEVHYDTTVERLEQEYPEINPESDEFDEAVVQRVQAMMTGVMQMQGKSPADALVEATNILLKPAKDAKGALRDKPSEAAAESGLRRTQQQIDKNIETAAKQPPATAEVGKDHDATGGSLSADAVAQMSWEEFVQLPESELAKMRGDYVN
jgi:hypothetical protein